MSRCLWGLAVKATEVCRQAKFGRMRTQAEELARQIEKGDPGGRVESSQESDRQAERIHIVASAMRRAPRPWLPIVIGEAQVQRQQWMSTRRLRCRLCAVLPADVRKAELLGARRGGEAGAAL